MMGDAWWVGPFVLGILSGSALMLIIRLVADLVDPGRYDREHFR
jgi:hypothetical protein